MVNSKELVEAQQAWRDYGFKGEGMVVGVIDTGIDHQHQDMVLADDTEVALTENRSMQPLKKKTFLAAIIRKSSIRLQLYG